MDCSTRSSSENADYYIYLIRRDYLDGHPDITFALVDHITSPSAVMFPVKEIASVCRERGVKVIVDGAHSPGQLPLNLADLGVDYYTGKPITAQRDRGEDGWLPICGCDVTLSLSV